MFVSSYIAALLVAGTTVLATPAHMHKRNAQITDILFERRETGISPEAQPIPVEQPTGPSPKEELLPPGGLLLGERPRPIPVGESSPAPGRLPEGELRPSPAGELTPSPLPGGEARPLPAGELTPSPLPGGEARPLPAGELTPSPLPGGEARPLPAGELTPSPLPGGEARPLPAGELTPSPLPAGEARPLPAGELRPSPLPTNERLQQVPGAIPQPLQPSPLAALPAPNMLALPPGALPTPQPAPLTPLPLAPLPVAPAPAVPVQPGAAPQGLKLPPIVVGGVPGVAGPAMAQTPPALAPGAVQPSTPPTAPLQPGSPAAPIQPGGQALVLPPIVIGAGGVAPPIQPGAVPMAMAPGAVPIAAAPVAAIPGQAVPTGGLRLPPIVILPGAAQPGAPQGALPPGAVQQGGSQTTTIVVQPGQAATITVNPNIPTFQTPGAGGLLPVQGQPLIPGQGQLLSPGLPRQTPLPIGGIAGPPGLVQQPGAAQPSGTLKLAAIVLQPGAVAPAAAPGNPAGAALAAPMPEMTPNPVNGLYPNGTDSRGGPARAVITEVAGAVPGAANGGVNGGANAAQPGQPGATGVTGGVAGANPGGVAGAGVRIRSSVGMGVWGALVAALLFHSWGVAVICLLFSPKGEAIKSTILGLIHDLGEIVMGDVIPSEGIKKEDKRRHEQFGQRYLMHVSQTDMMEPYFTEFEAGNCNAARIINEADSLECRIQAVIYILRYPEFEKLHEFLEFSPKGVYFQDLTYFLLKEEKLLQEKQLQMTIIFAIGGPDVGKDTQCAKLAEALDFCHIPTGNLLRKEIERIGSRYSNFIQKSIDIGFTVPAELMVSLLTTAAQGLKWLVNGFPRSFDQLAMFEQRVSRCYSILSLDCPENMPEHLFEGILRARLRKRITSSSRSDDKEDIIEKRLRSYQNEKSLRIYLQEKSLSKFEKIDSTGSEEEVYTLAKCGD